MASFAEKLKRLRRDRGWSQDELGRRIGIHGRHIGKYEIGNAFPNAETMVRLADTLETSIDYLLREDLEERAQARLHDKALVKRLEALEQMGDEDRHVVLTLIDAFIHKRQIQSVLQQ